MRLALLLLPLLLCACQDKQARQQNVVLGARVAALEQKVTTLEAAQAHAPTVAEAGNATTRAAAQNCATELARTLETYRQDSLERHYPTAAELEQPAPCSGQRIKWQQLGARAYAFTVQTADGQILARQQGP